jgi:hypothetical protein
MTVLAHPASGTRHCRGHPWPDGALPSREVRLDGLLLKDVRFSLNRSPSGVKEVAEERSGIQPGQPVGRSQADVVLDW